MSGSQLPFTICRLTIYDLQFGLHLHLATISSAFCVADAFVKVVVAHHHRRGAATGETFDEFDRELSVLRRLRAVRVRVQAQLLAKMFVQFIRRRPARSSTSGRP